MTYLCMCFSDDNSNVESNDTSNKFNNCSVTSVDEVSRDKQILDKK